MHLQQVLSNGVGGLWDYSHICVSKYLTNQLDLPAHRSVCQKLNCASSVQLHRSVDRPASR